MLGAGYGKEFSEKISRQGIEPLVRELLFAVLSLYFQDFYFI